MFRKVTVVLTAIFVVISLSSPAIANSVSEYEAVNPDSDIQYKIKRIKEKINLIYLSKIKRQGYAEYLMLLSDRRARELAYVVDNSLMNFLENSSSRYVSTIGILKEASPLPRELVIDHRENHMEIFAKLRQEYESDTAEWRIVQQAFETAQGM